MNRIQSPLASLSPDEFARQYAIAPESIESPALLVFRDQLERNLAAMVEIAGDPARLRPHCKTHKCQQIIQRELELGITRHKCATLAEAEMLAIAGVTDCLLAYCPVGPNLRRSVAFVEAFPATRLTVTVDHPQAVELLASEVAKAGGACEIGAMLDLDVGMHRTGTTAERGAIELYRQICKAPGIRPAGLHVYDGQNHQTELAERREAVLRGWNAACALREQLLAHDMPVPEIVAGGTGSFPVFAEIEDDGLSLSPGTPVLYDAGYSHMFPDLPFIPAALLLTRVISLPGNDLLTLDLGYKAVASDPPVERRATFPALPDATIVGQSEEHLMLRTAEASRFRLGDSLLAVPWHVCPTSAMHHELHVVDGGVVVERWEVTARDRKLTI